MLVKYKIKYDKYCELEIYMCNIDTEYYISSCNPYKMRPNKVIFNCMSSNMMSYNYGCEESKDAITESYLRVYDDLHYLNNLLFCVFSEIRSKYA